MKILGGMDQKLIPDESIVNEKISTMQARKLAIIVQTRER